MESFLRWSLSYKLKLTNKNLTQTQSAETICPLLVVCNLLKLLAHHSSKIYTPVYIQYIYTPVWSAQCRR